MCKSFVYQLGLPNLIILTKLHSIVLFWIGIVKNDSSLFLPRGKNNNDPNTSKHFIISRVEIFEKIDGNGTI